MFDWFKSSSRRNRRYVLDAAEVLTKARQWEALSDEALSARWKTLRQEQGKHVRLDALALAVVAGRRHLGFWAHAEQIWGALALMDGHIAEMRTGEGKTFTAVLAAATEAEEFEEIYGKVVVEVATHKPMVRIDHPDVICVSKADKLRRIADEVEECHRQGRPVLVGTPSVAASEEIAQLLAQRGLVFEVLNARQHEREASIIANAGRPGAITVTTAMAGRGTDIVLGGEPGEDGWQARHDAVVALGGLHVLGTERHESRRIDNQLRGRAGRQGDPGSSRFYLSMEDNLLRIFSTGWAQGLLKALGIQDGNTIESPTIAKQIARAQKQVEAHHYEARKNLLEFDSIVAHQRRLFYAVRERVLNEGFEWRTWESDIRDVGLETTPEQEKVLDEVDPAAGRLVFLHHWDLQWRAYLDRLTMVRQGIHLRGMAQQKPLQEYQREAVRLFAQMQRLAWEGILFGELDFSPQTPLNEQG